MKQLLILAFAVLTGFHVNAQDALPAVSLSNLKGEKVDISQLHQGGKIIVMDFWATWCVPCKK